MSLTVTPTIAFTANVAKQSAAFTIPASASAIQVAMTSTTPTWGSLGVGSLTFGIEYSTDGGATWTFLCGCDAAHGSAPFIFGAFSFDGSLPAWGCSREPAVVGNLVRAYGVATANLSVTLSVTIS